MARLESLYGELAPVQNVSPVQDLKSLQDPFQNVFRLMLNLDGVIPDGYHSDMDFLAAEADREVPLWMSDHLDINAIETSLKKVRQATILILKEDYSTFDETMRA